MVFDRLLAFGPHNGAHRIAVRAAVSIALPLLVLWATGHLAWSIYAAFGAFTSLYGRERVGWPRLSLQGVAAFTLVGGVVLGVLVGTSADRRWLAVPVAALISFVTAAESARSGWHPPGALFQIFAFASVASVPSHPREIGTAAAVSACAAGCALLIGNAGDVWRRLRGQSVDAVPPAGGFTEGRWRYAGLYAGGVALAGAIATGTGIGRPYWAMVGAAAPLVAREFMPGLVRGLQRIIGTLAGLVVAWALLEAGPHGVVVVLIVAVLQALAELFVGRNYAVALVAITPLALLMVAMVAPMPIGTLLFDRGVETVIGAGTGIVVGWVAQRGRAVTSE